MNRSNSQNAVNEQNKDAKGTKDTKGAKEASGRIGSDQPPQNAEKSVKMAAKNDDPASKKPGEVQATAKDAPPNAPPAPNSQPGTSALGILTHGSRAIMSVLSGILSNRKPPPVATKETPASKTTKQVPVPVPHPSDTEQKSLEEKVFKPQRPRKDFTIPDNLMKVLKKKGLEPDRSVGHGTYGRVFRSKNTSTEYNIDPTVAIKLIPVDMPDEVKRVLDKAERAEAKAKEKAEKAEKSKDKKKPSREVITSTPSKDNKPADHSSRLKEEAWHREVRHAKREEKKWKQRNKMLERELRDFSGLKHPNAVTIYGHFYTETKPNYACIVMEWCPYGSLLYYCYHIKPGLSEDLGGYWFNQLCEVLKYMHTEFHACHRDVKLDNILIDGNMNIKLADFSFAIKISKDRTKIPMQKLWCGTAPYYSPEIIQHQPYDPIKLDVWCSGVCLYIMMCDEFPFHFKQRDGIIGSVQLEEQRVVREVFKKERPNFEELPKKLKELILSLLEFDQNKRPDFDAILENKWVKEHRKRPEYIEKPYARKSVQSTTSSSSGSSSGSEKSEVSKSKSARRNSLELDTDAEVNDGEPVDEKD